LVTLAHVDGIALNNILKKEDRIDVDNGGNGAYTYVAQTEANNVLLLNAFLTNFESRSITDSFLLRIIDTDTNTTFYEGYGSIQSISTSTDPSSPVVWTVNVDFMVGNVISIYDADTPEAVTNVDINVPSSGTIRFRWNDPARAGGSNITEFDLGYQKVNEAVTNYTTVTYSDATASITGGKYQKDITGLTGQYFVFIVAKNTGGTGTRSERIRVDAT
jgi:hypothetical protein